ncbi:MAG: CoA transferase [Spongiibacteraceae bacterium]
MQTMAEVHSDRQVRANGYIQSIALSDAQAVKVVAPPVQLDAKAGTAKRSPHLGEHTDAVLNALGFSAVKIAELRAQKIER